MPQLGIEQFYPFNNDEYIGQCCKALIFVLFILLQTTQRMIICVLIFYTTLKLVFQGFIIFEK